MRQLLRWVTDERRRRNGEIAAAMRADGIPVTLEGLSKSSPESVVGRPHFAAALVSLGLATDENDAFRRDLNKGTPYFRKRRYIPLRQAFEVIRDAGGKAVMAHPLQYRLPEEDLPELVKTLTDAGAVGMECLYSQYGPAETEYLKSLAQRFDLCVTGGSDFHGSRKPIEMGTPKVPYALLEGLRAR